MRRKQWAAACASAVVAVSLAGFEAAGTASAASPATELVSKSSVGNGGFSGDGPSNDAALSGDGRFVAFASNARNLVPATNWGDTGTHVFLKDRATGINRLVTVKRRGENDTAAEPGSGAPSISADGRFIAYSSIATDLVSGDTNRRRDIFIYDVEADSTVRIPARFGAEPNGNSTAPAISGNGTYVTFQSTASNISTGDTNGLADIFRYNRLTGVTELVSRSSTGASANGGSEAPSISHDGNKIAYQSSANNLVSSDTNASRDVFVRVMDGSSSSFRASVTASNGQANGESRDPAISGDGTHVAFASMATNLTAVGDINGVSDIFSRTLTGSTTTRQLSRSAAQGQANGASTAPSVNVDGTVVAFSSTATNLVSGDVNGKRDVFVIGVACSSCTSVASVASDGGTSAADSNALSVSADGRLVLFRSEDRLTPEPDGNNGEFDIYLRTAS